MDKMDIKRAIRFLSLIVAFGGSFILLIFTFMINDALDKIERTTISNIEAIEGTLFELVSTLETVKTEIDSTNATIDNLQKSFEPISNGLSSAGDSLLGIAETMSTISFFNLENEADKLEEAGNSMLEASKKIQLTNFEEHNTNFVEISNSIEGIKNSIEKQRIELLGTKKTIKETITLAKIANILLFFVIIAMFVVLSLNSAAGLIT